MQKVSKARLWCRVTEKKKDKEGKIETRGLGKKEEWEIRIDTLRSTPLKEECRVPWMIRKVTLRLEVSKCG